MRSNLAFLVLLSVFVAGPTNSVAAAVEDEFLSSIRQLTFEGRRAGEGYFSADGTQMTFQSERDLSNPFYQIQLMDMLTGDVATVSPGYGKTTCAWIHPSGQRVIYASTHEDPEARAKMQALLEPLDGVHDGRNFDIQEINRPVNRPVVLTHPETGRKALYVNEGFTRAIDGLPRDESNAICKFLYAHWTKERYQARLRYEPGTLSIWDNRCVQHMAVPDFNGETRELHRVAVLCDAPPTR